MTIRLKKGSAVPIVISEKVVKEAPKTIRKTSFIGFRKGLSNLVDSVKCKFAELIHESFFEEKIEVIDPGVIDEKHYVVQIGGDEYDPQLTVERADYKPPCAHHYEVIKVEKEVQEPDSKSDYIDKFVRPDESETASDGAVPRGWVTDRPTARRPSQSGS